MKVACVTLGCRTNQHDTAEMQTLLEQEGFSIVTGKEKADAYVINTCTVTQRSDYSSRLAVKKSLAINPEALVVFTGCYAQLNPKEASKLDGLDIVLGNADKLEIANLLKYKLLNPESPWLKSSDTEIIMSDIHKDRIFRTIPVNNFQGMTKAFIKIQTGCDEKCSFCTVVKARGKSISDSRENIISNIHEAIGSGFKEITLTGINLGTWGMDRKETFSSLVQEIVEIPGNFRVRLSSINPMEIDSDLMRLIAESEKLCSHLHIPLQSGDDRILKSMRRNYNREQYLEVAERALNIIPGLGLGADVIVGFPGETEEDFQDTMDIVKYVEFDSVYMFQFSPRPGTKAFDMEDEFVDKEIIKKRFQHLKDVQTDISEKRLKRFVGTEQVLLIEKPSKKNNQVLTGKIDSGQITHIDNKNVSTGDIVEVKIIDSTPFYLKAELI